MTKIFSASNRWSAVGRVLLFYLFCVIFLMVAAPFGSKFPGQWSKVAIGSMASVATLALTVLFVWWDGIRLADVGAALSSRSVVRLLLGFLAGLLMVAVQSSFGTFGGHVHWVRTAGTGIAPIAMALLAYLVLACREELTFHGYPLRRLERFFGIWAAQIIVALAFGLEHRVGGFTWFNAMLGSVAGSLLFGMASIATRGLAVPIGLHAAWNFGQWVLGEKDLPGLWRPVIEENYQAHVDHVGLIGYFGVFGAATAAFWLFRMAQFRREREHALAKSSA